MATRQAEGRYDVTQSESLWITVSSVGTLCSVEGAVNQTALTITCGKPCEIKPLYLHGPSSFNFVTLFLAFSEGSKNASYQIQVADSNGTIDTIVVRQDPARALPYEDSYTINIKVV
jgi:hypothetical protein